MADQTPKSRSADGLIRVLPASVTGPEPQNPAPFTQEGQVDDSRVRAVADQITTVFLNSLPSNYVAQTKGPYYIQQFQAISEELARIQVTAEDAYEDADYDFTRSEVLFQFLSDLIFPTSAETGLPIIDGDLTYRAFLQKMVLLLLKGSKAVTLLQGVEALTDAEVDILEKFKFIGQPGVAWGPADRFTFEINISKYRSGQTRTTTGCQVDYHYHTIQISAAGDGVTTATTWEDGSGPDHVHTITGFQIADSVAIIGPPALPVHTHDLLSDFADLPIILAKNVEIVMRALRPAHTLYEYRNLFRETYHHVFTDDYQKTELDSYYYDDFRKYCSGVKEISSSTGVILADRYTLNDVVSFRSVRSGALLVVVAGSNVGRYMVRETCSFPFGDDPVARVYTTSPTGLTGKATVVDGAFVDAAQNWALAAPGEILTLTVGPNAGKYVLETLLGLNGGPLGEITATGPATEVRPAVCFLRVSSIFPVAASGVDYTVEVDRLGVRSSIEATNESVTDQFASPPAGAVTSFFTAHGPLVRRYGDATPATVSDVTVLYDGLPVTVSSVNPYTGEITLAAPIVRFAAGLHTVEVTYRWFPAPLMGFTGLNTKGLTLNRWSLASGRTATSPTSGGLWGGYRTSRFPLSLALGRFPTRKPPVKIAHRYIAFERAYTSALNSPTTLLLNQAPGRFTVPYAQADIQSTTVQYEGTAVPADAWTSTGAVTGTSDGDRYTLTESSPTEVGYWSRDFELPVASMVGTAARFQIDSYTLDGVFTGVAFGFHNDRRLYLAGALVINGLKHIGLLARPGEISSLSSWIVGPVAVGTIQSSKIVTCTLAQAPKLLASGQKFQILKGNQAGVYTVDQVYINAKASRVTVTILEAFPGDPALYGNRDAELVFETAWDAGQCTWRLYASTRNDAVQLVFGGATGGTLATVSGGPVLASPAYLGPDVLPQGAGRYLWGSFDRKATNTVTWDFVRYLSTPDGGTRFLRGTLVDTQMTGDPEDAEWFLTTPYGDSATSGGLLRITATPAEEALDTSYGYGLIDPFLNGRRVVAFDAKLNLDRDTSGAGGAAISLKDTHREARLGNILYQDNGALGKQVIPQESFSLVGAVGYGSQGWGGFISSGFDLPNAFANGPETLLADSGENSWIMAQSFLVAPTSSGRTLEFRLAITDYTVSSTGTIGLTFMANVLNRVIGLTFTQITGVDYVNLTDITTGFVLGSAAIPWSDGVRRTYRLDISTEALVNFVSMFVDDVFEGGVPYTTFPGVLTSADGLSFGYLTETDASFTASLSTLCFMDRLDEVPNLHRTFGIWKGGAFSDLNNWAIPRSDGLSVPNSDPASVLVDMDWSVECWVRLFVDPTFGAVFIRPDLNPPPGYTGNFATQSLDPTAAWARVEYSCLPRAVSDTRFGSVYFGALNPAASTLQFWNEVRYRVFTNTSVDYRAPQRMALNQWNVISSGDYLKDRTPEQVIVAALTPTRVSLRPAHIFANRVFLVIVEGVPLAADSWRFNVDSQEITLFSALPSTGYPVTVVFAVGKPVTTTYLQSQPLPESQTILNEGTPVVPMGQVGQATVTTISGTGGPVPAFPPATPADPDYFLKDQYLSRKFVDDPALLYEQMSFFQIEDDGSRGKISSICDGPGNGTGWRELGLDGALFTENLSPTTSPYASNFGRGAGRFGPVLHASGGRAGILGLLGPASYATPFSVPNPVPTGLVAAITYPTGPSAGVVPGSGVGAVNREILWVLRLGASPGSVLSNAVPPIDTPLIEGTISAPIVPITADQNYASKGPAPISPSVAGPVTGAAWYQLAGVALFPRLGPWAGVAALTSNSLLYGASSLQPSGIPLSGQGMVLQGGTPLPPTPAPVSGML